MCIGIIDNCDWRRARPHARPVAQSLLTLTSMVIDNIINQLATGPGSPHTLCRASCWTRHRRAPGMRSLQCSPSSIRSASQSCRRSRRPPASRTGRWQHGKSSLESLRQCSENGGTGHAKQQRHRSSSVFSAATGFLSNCELTWAGYCININF